MKTSKLTFALLLVAVIGISLAACTPNSVAEEDSLYIDHQGIEKAKIEMPSNG